MHILLVDDNEVDRLAVARALRSAGLEATLHEADTVDGAIALLSEARLDCVLLDYRLPGGDGLDVLRQVKKRDLAIPVIILTGHGDEKTAVEFMKAGADDYLQKSNLSADRLSDTLRHAAERRRLEQERDELLFREQQARSDAERANAEKDQFLASLAHELRTPLSAVLGWTRVLADPALDRKRIDYGLAVIERNAKIQLQLIDDLLDVSRIISGKLELQMEAVNPIVICDAAIDAVRDQVDKKHISVEKYFDADCGLVQGDATRLQQVIWNLLTNSIKFTPVGGTITLSLRRGPATVDLIVTDNGRGIPKEALTRIFDRFNQISSADHRAHGGLGLGLAIVRTLAELHGGTVYASSDGAGLGATFTVSLPVTQATPAADQTRTVTAPAVHQRLDGVRVLFIDDNADARELIATILGERGARVRTCDSTESALAALQRERPDVVISDIEMPGRDGYEMIRALRLRDEDTQTPIPAIALSGQTRTEDRIRMLSSGFQVHIPKPVEPAELIAAVNSLAPTRRSSKSSSR
jgi:signal transduction histidine kinase